MEISFTFALRSKCACKEWEEIFARHISETGIFNIKNYNSATEKHNPNSKMSKGLDISPKKICKWIKST